MSENSNEPSSGTDRVKLDATGEFFSVGAPLHAVRAGYVRRPADNVLYETLSAGRYAHVIAPDRSGKSSLVAATAARLENNGHKVAILDLEQIGGRESGSEEGRWYYSIAYRLLRQLRIRIDLHSWWQDKSMLSNRQRLLEFYSEIVLQYVSERVVIFVDEVQCVASLGFANQFLASIRSAHNARATDPEFSRLTFVLLGECDPLSLVSESELSPFNVTQAVTLGDFRRQDLDLFLTELNLAPDVAALALDRIFHWTSGQPYLSQKLARAVAREQLQVKTPQDISQHIDRIVSQQLAGRAALHSEPHMSHIHREIVNDSRHREALLNMYGRICKNVHVATDLGSPLQRRLIAIGLIVIDDEGRLKVRNRIYEGVFTARWANENLRGSWRAPLAAAAVLLGILFIPFWYTQLLPKPYVAALTSAAVALPVAENAYVNYRSFPGHAVSADNLYISFLKNRAAAATDLSEIQLLVGMAEAFPEIGNLAVEMLASFWDRQATAAMRNENRDQALLATIESLQFATPRRRNRAAMLVSEDYPQLITSLLSVDRGHMVFNPDNLLLTASNGSQVSQWTLVNQDLQARESWTITALEVTPLVRRVIVDSPGSVRRIGLTINLSHARAGDLRIKLIAPSGRAVEVEPRVERASSNQDIRIDSNQLRDLLGESITGTWSLSVRDEELGVAGQLVGWNLQLNSQGLVEEFQRGLNISDPVERETGNIWFGPDGRFAVARATQSDSARIWDLAYAKPIRAVAVSEHEQLVGLSADARRLVTAAQDTVNVWDTASGDRIAELAIGAVSGNAILTQNGSALLVQRRNALDTRFELWSLQSGLVGATLDVAGTPALVSLDTTGSRIAIADYDRAVRVWDLQSNELLAQIDLAMQPSRIELAAAGQVLGVIFGEQGASLWRIDRPKLPLFEELDTGRWNLSFSPSGSMVLIGTRDQGFQIHASEDGHLLGAAIGAAASSDTGSLLGFSADERVVFSGGPEGTVRFWKTPTVLAASQPNVEQGDPIWSPAGDAVVAVTPDARLLVIGDRQGDVHMLSTDSSREALQSESQSIGFLGHSRKIRLLAVSADGSRVASAADDNSVRVWDTADGLPRPFFGHVSGNVPQHLAFSPDALMLGILSSNHVSVLDTSTGAVIAQMSLAEVHHGIAFGAGSKLYLGSESGRLSVLQKNAAADWSLQSLWQGPAAVRWLEVAPQSQFLVVVDQNNLAQQFVLPDGRPGESSLQLPGPVEEVRFAPGGSRVMFRTARWIHRASSSAFGLLWIDAVFAPRSIRSAHMVFGAPGSDPQAALGGRVFVPVARDSYVQLVELYFDNSHGATLFGSRDELMADWQHRFGQRAGSN